jgi:hypothetical protein
VLDTYDCDECDLVFRHLRYFAQQHTLVLLARDNPLFQRMRSNLADMPRAVVIERQFAPEGQWLENWGPSSRYGSSEIRAVWAALRKVLDQNRVPAPPAAVTADVRQESISLSVTAPTGAQADEEVPVLIRTSYHPSWRRSDREPVFAVNPMFMLKFVRQNATLAYSRRWFDWVALSVSALTLLGLSFYTARHYLRRPREAGGGVS